MGAAKYDQPRLFAFLAQWMGNAGDGLAFLSLANRVESYYVVCC
jgi:hypothetical protein